jgi:aminopeptidase N
MATFDKRPNVYADVVYSRGACTWGTLERQWGSRRLLRVLRRYVARHRFGVATQDDLIRALRDGAPKGFRLTRFLRDAGIRPL